MATCRNIIDLNENKRKEKKATLTDTNSIKSNHIIIIIITSVISAI